MVRDIEAILAGRSGIGKLMLAFGSQVLQSQHKLLIGRNVPIASSVSETPKIAFGAW